jgi:hypothetical protein
MGNLHGQHGTHSFLHPVDPPTYITARPATSLAML